MRISPIFLSLVCIHTLQPITAQVDFSAPQSAAILPLQSNEIPWLGFQVERVTETVRAHLVDLPKGTGFVIARIESQSPCHLAGLLRHDIVWKFDDQLLINEAQLEVLLSHKRPGDSVKVHFIRHGVKQETTIVIGRKVEQKIAIMGPSSVSSDTQNIQFPPNQALVPTETQKTASLELPNAFIQIETRDTSLWLSIDHKGVNIFDDELNAESEKKIPPVWIAPVLELRRTLEDRCASQIK